MEGIAGGPIDGSGSSGDSGTGSKEFVRDMVMRVRSMSERDMRGWGFLTGDGVALPIELIIWSASASSASTSSGSKVGIGGSEICSGEASGRSSDNRSSLCSEWLAMVVVSSKGEFSTAGCKAGDVVSGTGVLS